MKTTEIEGGLGRGRTTLLPGKGLANCEPNHGFLRQPYPISPPHPRGKKLLGEFCRLFLRRNITPSRNRNWSSWRAGGEHLLKSSMGRKWQYMVERKPTLVGMLGHVCKRAGKSRLLHVCCLCWGLLFFHLFHSFIILEAPETAESFRCSSHACPDVEAVCCWPFFFPNWPTIQEPGMNQLIGP